MVNNQFVYTRKEPIRLEVGGTGEFVEFKDSFNTNLILRSRGLENGQRIVLLNDLHEQWTTTPVLGKNGKIASYKREKDIFQSEILLEKEDADRFIKLLAIE